MGARLRLWWQQIKTHSMTTVLIPLVIALVVLVILGGYLFHWDWTGFNGNIKSGKTLWDWMQLLFIPVVLAVAGFWFNHRERRAAELRAENERKAAGLRAEAEREIEQQRAKAEQEIASDNQREAALQAFINELSELLLHVNLRESKPENEVGKIARVRTLMVLRRLDGLRKGSVLQFLHESGLIDKDKRIIDLRGAHLDGAYLDHADLSGVDLSGAYLAGACLIDADLSGANLRGACLEDTDLRGACLEDACLAGAYLFEAHLAGANITPEQLATAKEDEEIWYP